MIYNEHIFDDMSLWTDLCHYCFSFGCQDRCLHSLQCRPWNWLGSSLANLIGNEFWLLSLIFKLATWVSKGILPIRYFHSNFILCKLIVYFSFPLSYFNIILAGLVPLSDPSFLHLSGKNIKLTCQIGIFLWHIWSPFCRKFPVKVPTFGEGEGRGVKPVGTKSQL